MWKYVSRRIRDTFERSVNHFDKRSTTGIVNSPGNASEDNSKRSPPPCRWFCSRKCWGSSQEYNDTNSKRWNFEQLNRTWIGAITWSGALVAGWYTSQLIHLKLKHSCYRNRKAYLLKSSLYSSVYPYLNCVNKTPAYLNTVSQLEKLVGTFTPTVHLMSNEQNHVNNETSSTDSNGTLNSDSTDDELGDVLNSIENKLGLAAIENGHHQDGLNLLRSAANRNHAPALYNLGLCYEMGLGVSVNEKVAMELYRSAAALEHPGALYNLGVYYGQGRGGLTRDTEMATRLLRLAAIQGQENAITALKSLEDTSELMKEGDSSWMYGCTPYDNSIVPTHTTLFVENVNYLRIDNNATTVY